MQAFVDWIQQTEGGPLDDKSLGLVLAVLANDSNGIHERIDLIGVAETDLEFGPLCFALFSFLCAPLDVYLVAQTLPSSMQVKRVSCAGQSRRQTRKQDKA